MSPNGSVLIAALQSATMQDGGDSKKHENCSRVLRWNLATLDGVPKLEVEQVLALPVDPITLETDPLSEIHYITDNILAALCRDGRGDGNWPPSDANSTTKCVV